jgi:hypothetical protein
MKLRETAGIPFQGQAARQLRFGRRRADQPAQGRAQHVGEDQNQQR